MQHGIWGSAQISSNSTLFDETLPKKCKSLMEIYEFCSFAFYVLDPIFYEEAEK